jgi:hypothetical protein
MTKPVDGSLCPLCAKPNICMVDAKEPCWCLEQTFDEGLLEKVPEKLKNKSCICQSCVLKHALLAKNITNLS